MTDSAYSDRMVKGSHAGELCAYCADTKLTGDEKPEHAVPAALGASLRVWTVCDGCNEWAGREIDQPFLEDQLLRERRSMVDQRDPRRGKKARRANSTFLQGHTAAGDFVRFDHELGRPVMGSRIVQLDDGRIEIRAGSQDEANRLMAKLEARAANEGKKVKIDEIAHGEEKPEITAKVMIRTDVWRREMAKIALAVGSVVYPPEWRVSADAERLREWMNGNDRTADDGSAPPLIPSVQADGMPLAEADEHLLYLAHLSDGSTYLSLVLFGNITVALPIDTTGAAAPEQAWKLDWRTPTKDGSTTFDGIVTAAVLASMPPDDEPE